MKKASKRWPFYFISIQHTGYVQKASELVFEQQGSL
jgi:hypothetical protein